MTDLLEGIAAVLLFGFLNILLIARVGASQSSGEGAFLARVYAATGVEDHDLVYPDEAESAARA